MSMMGGMFGGGSGGKNTFGQTQAGAAGRWLDVTLYTSRNPSLAEAAQAVPAGTQLAPALKLIAPKVGTPPPGDESVVEPEYQRPKGRMSLYWGCGDTVRAGQPRVLDIASARPEDYQKFFVSRRATQRGTHLAAGRPVWSNEVDSRMVPANASLVGEHAFSGQALAACDRQQDLTAIDLKQSVPRCDATAAARRPRARTSSPGWVPSPAPRPRWCSGLRARCPNSGWDCSTTRPIRRSIAG
jgi:hypothetical protein